MESVKISYQLVRLDPRYNLVKLHLEIFFGTIVTLKTVYLEFTKRVLVAVHSDSFRAHHWSSGCCAIRLGPVICSFWLSGMMGVNTVNCCEHLLAGNSCQRCRFAWGPSGGALVSSGEALYPNLQKCQKYPIFRFC